MNVKDDLINNMGRYFTYIMMIFKNSKFRSDKETYQNGIDYFVKLLKSFNKNINPSEAKL